MIGTLAIEITAHSPQKPLCPIFSFRNSPSSIRLTGIPKSVGSWNITRVYVIATSPDNSTQEIDCVRTGNVWVGTFNGCETAGKVLQGVSIMADGVDENNQPVEGYCLGKSDYYVMDAQSDIKALVEKYEVRYLQDLPTNPSIGDMYLANGTMKFFTGSEWVDFGGGSTEGLVTEEEFNEFKEGVTASLSVIDSSLSILSASASTMGESISAISASISTMTSSISTMTSSISALTSTKRNYTDLSWKYTRTTDPVMYGVKKFHVVKDEDGQQSHSYDLMDFDETAKVWSEYEAPVSIRAYGPNLYAVIDEDNPHTFEYDDQEYSGWEFFRVNDSETQFTVSGGGANIEYHINLTRRADDTFALDSTVAEKRDYDDLTWDYPLEQDSDRFGVGNFNVDLNGSLFSLTQFSKTSESRTWSQLDAGSQDRFEIYTSDGRHYNLLDKVEAKTMPFTRTGNDNVVWSIETSNNAYVVRAIRREQGRLAIYEPDISDPDQVVLDFGQSSAGLVLGTNLTASTQAFMTLDDVTLTGTNYVSSRAATRGATKRDGSTPHLKVNGETVAFTSEIEGATSSIQSEIDEVTASVSAMASTVEANTSSISAIVSSLSSYATTSYVDQNAKTVWRTWKYIPGLILTAEEANSTVSMTANGSAPEVSLEYTTDGSTWSDFIVGTTTVTLANVGDKMMLRAKTTNTGMGSSTSDCNQFVMTGKIAASGSIMYLLKNDGDLDTIPSSYCFSRLFYQCASLTTAPELPATTLAQGCYYYMLRETSLTQAPELPATTLASGCYWSMFKNCTSLTTVPEISATTIATESYRAMFDGCSSLNSIKIAYTGKFSGTGVPTDAFYQWVYHVSSTGTFYYNGSDTKRGNSAIPTNWDVQTF